MKNCLFLLFFLLPSVCFGAITFDQSDTGTVSTADANWTLTYSADVASGDNVIMVVGVLSQTQADGQDMAHSSVTFNGDSLTQIGTTVKWDGAGNPHEYASLWYILAPDETTGNVVVSGTATAGTNRVNSATIVIQGAKQQAPEVSGTANGFGATASKAITTVTNNAWAIDMVANINAAIDMTAAAGQTERYEHSTGDRGNGSTKPVATAGSTTMSWTLSAARDWVIMTAAFAEAGRRVMIVN